MRKFWPVLLMILPMVFAVRTLTHYGSVGIEEGRYYNDSYASFGSNVNKAYLTTNKCVLGSSSSLGPLVKDINNDSKNEIVLLGNGQISIYDNNCKLLNSTSLLGELKGNGFIINPDKDQFQEIAAAVYDPISNRVKIKVYDHTLKKVYDFNLADQKGNLNFLGLACMSTDKTYCAGIYDEGSAVKVNSIEIPSGSMVTKILTRMHGSCVARADALWIGQFNGNSMIDDDLLWGCIVNRIEDNQWFLELRVISIFDGQEILTISDNFRGHVGNPPGYTKFISAPSFIQLGAKDSPMEIAVAVETNKQYDSNQNQEPLTNYRIYSGSGEAIFKFNNPPGAMNTGGKGSNIASADLMDDSSDDFCFIDNLGFFRCYDDNMKLLYRWNMTTYKSKDKTSIAIGDINSIIGKELISNFGIFSMSGTKLADLGLSNEKGVFNVVDVNKDGADEVLFSKQLGSYQYFSNPTTTTTSIITTTSVPVIDKTPFICSFLDIAGKSPKACVKQRKIGCSDCSAMIKTIDSANFFLNLNSSSSENVQVWNNTIGNRTDFLRIEFDFNVNSMQEESMIYLDIFGTNENKTKPTFSYYIESDGFVYSDKRLCKINLEQRHKAVFEFNITARKTRAFIDNIGCSSGQDLDIVSALAFAIGSRGFNVDIDTLRVKTPNKFTTTTTTTVPSTKVISTSKLWDHIAKGTIITWSMQHIDISELTLDFTKSTDNAEVIVSTAPDAPKLESLKVYDYFTIYSNIKDPVNLDITFNVDNSWLGFYEIPRTNIALYYYDDGWRKAITWNEGTHYRATNTGFGYYAIAEKEPTQRTTTTKVFNYPDENRDNATSTTSVTEVPRGKATTTVIPNDNLANLGPVFIAIIAIAIAVIVAVYLNRKK